MHSCAIGTAPARRLVHDIVLVRPASNRRVADSVPDGQAVDTAPTGSRDPRPALASGSEAQAVRGTVGLGV